MFTEPVVISSDNMKDNKPVNLKGGMFSTRRKDGIAAGTRTLLQHSTLDSTIDRREFQFETNSIVTYRGRVEVRH